MALKEEEKKILTTFAEIIPQMSENEKSRLLWIGEGMALMVQKNTEKGGGKKHERSNSKEIF